MKIKKFNDSASIIPQFELDPFSDRVKAVCLSITMGSNQTRLAYLSDARLWLAFCRQCSDDPKNPDQLTIAAWVEDMRNNHLAPKTRVRRLAALSSIYAELLRGKHVGKNPFSIETGPRREKPRTLKPTPLAFPADIKAILATCDESPGGLRDAAIIRILWATGARRASIVSMTFERLQYEGDGYIAVVTAKGDKEIKIFIKGKASKALLRWLAHLSSIGIRKGPIWWHKNKPLTAQGIWKIVQRRGELAGITNPLTPHAFRVAFLTLNPASLDARQDAAGHADPATTRLYDRKWRGREAFDAMPEVEDI